MTKLIRVQDETYETLQKLAGKMQAKTGRKASLDRAIQTLLEERRPKKGGSQAPDGKKGGEENEFADSVKWFSLHHKAFKPENQPVSSTKIEQTPLKNT